MFFSISPVAALVPLSMPPCPGSITTSGRGSPFGFCSGWDSALRVADARFSSATVRRNDSRSVPARSSTMRAG
jgi:hypothetical protein